MHSRKTPIRTIIFLLRLQQLFTTMFPGCMERSFENISQKADKAENDELRDAAHAPLRMFIYASYFLPPFFPLNELFLSALSLSPGSDDDAISIFNLLLSIAAFTNKKLKQNFIVVHAAFMSWIIFCLQVFLIRNFSSRFRGRARFLFGHLNNKPIAFFSQQHKEQAKEQETSFSRMSINLALL